MSKLSVFGMTLSLAAVVMPPSAFGQDGCVQTCHDEQRCVIKAEPCGSNEDGTLIMCPVEECRTVRVCEFIGICQTRPTEDIASVDTSGVSEALDTLPPFDPVPFF
jgi:hypothetical protein